MGVFKAYVCANKQKIAATASSAYKVGATISILSAIAAAAQCRRSQGRTAVAAP